MRAGIEGRWPLRFVIVSTLLRGVLKKPELLDDANQWRAFSAWREDESREARVEYELGYVDSEVVWAKKPVQWVGREYLGPVVEEVG